MRRWLCLALLGLVNAFVPSEAGALTTLLPPVFPVYVQGNPYLATLDGLHRYVSEENCPEVARLPDLFSPASGRRESAPSISAATACGTTVYLASGGRVYGWDALRPGEAPVELAQPGYVTALAATRDAVYAAVGSEVLSLRSGRAELVARVPAREVTGLYAGGGRLYTSTYREVLERIRGDGRDDWATRYQVRPGEGAVCGMSGLGAEPVYFGRFDGTYQAVALESGHSVRLPERPSGIWVVRLDRAALGVVAGFPRDWPAYDLRHFQSR